MLILIFATVIVVIILTIMHRCLKARAKITVCVCLSFFLLVATIIYCCNIKETNNLFLADNTLQIIEQRYPELYLWYLDMRHETPMSPPNQEFETIDISWPNLHDTWKQVSPIVQHFIKEYGISALGFVIFCFVISRIRLYNMNKQYINNLRLNLTEKKNEKSTWREGNKLEEVLVSIHTATCDKHEDLDLLSYCRDQLENNSGMVYIVLGNPGEGKTMATIKIADMLVERYVYIPTFFKYIMKNLLGRSAPPTSRTLIPIMMTFNDIKNISEVEDFIAKVKDKINGVLKRDHFHSVWERIRSSLHNRFKKNLRNGDFVFILDGYDEISEDLRHSTALVLTDFHNTYSKCNLIITSRTVVYHENNFFGTSKNRILQLLPLSKPKILEFISKWNFPPDKDKNLLFRRLTSDFQLGRLAQNPFLLTMICNLYGKNDLSVINSITQFFSEAIKCMLETWEQKKPFPPRFLTETDQKLSVLAHLAYEQYRLKENRDLPLLQVKTYSNQMLSEIAIQSNLIHRHDNNTYEFLHRSIMEYFIAYYFGEQKLNICLLDYDIPRNRDIINFYHAMNSDVGQTEQYLFKRSDKLGVLEQLFFERVITSSELIDECFNQQLTLLEPYATLKFQEIGVFAARYPQVADDLHGYILEQISLSKDAYYASNLMICAMCCMQKSVLIMRLMQICINKFGGISRFIDWANVMDDKFDEFIINLHSLNIDTRTKVDVARALAGYEKKELLVQLYSYTVQNPIDHAIISYGLLCMSDKEFFWEWIASQNLPQYSPESVNGEIEKYYAKYGWRDQSISKSAQKMVYHLVYSVVHSLRDLSEILEENNSVISNKVKFLLKCKLKIHYKR